MSGFFHDLATEKLQTPEDIAQSGYRAKIRVLENGAIQISTGVFRLNLRGALFAELRRQFASGWAQSISVEVDVSAADDDTVTVTGTPVSPVLAAGPGLVNAFLDAMDDGRFDLSAEALTKLREWRKEFE